MKIELKSAQELIKASPDVMCGFNQFIFGSGEPKRSNYGDKSQWYTELQGYNYAKKMAEEDGIAFTNVFKCKKEDCYPFSFGGFFVCNNCGGKGVDKEWWKIQVKKDGDCFCCHGLDFQDLQSSNNYAFGSTFEESISNYESVMLQLQPNL